MGREQGMIQQPTWVIIDEVLDFVDADSRELISGILAKRLKDSAIVHIGRQLVHDNFLVNDTTVRKLPGKRRRSAESSAIHVKSA